MKNTDTLDAPELPTDLTPDPGQLPAPDPSLLTDDGPGVRGLSLSGIPAPFPPTTPIVGTNGGQRGGFAVWTGTNVLGNMGDVIDSGGFYSSVVMDSPYGGSITISSAGVPKLILTGKNNAYIQSGVNANLVIGTTIDAQTQFQNASVSVWLIDTNGQGNAFRPLNDNGPPIGLTSNVTGLTVASPSYVAGYTIRPVGTRTTINGSTSGSIIVTFPMSGSANRKIIIVVQNLTGTATYPFTMAWSFTPGIFAQTAALIAAVTAISTSSVTITGSGTTGVIILEGF